MTKQKPKSEKHLEYAILLASKIAEVFDEEGESDIQLNLKEIRKEENLTDFIHALATVMPFTFYQKLTGDDEMDIVAFNHMANRLIFQYSKIK